MCDPDRGLGACVLTTFVFIHPVAYKYMNNNSLALAYVDNEVGGTKKLNCMRKKLRLAFVTFIISLPPPPLPPSPFLTLVRQFNHPTTISDVRLRISANRRCATKYARICFCYTKALLVSNSKAPE